MSAIWKYPLEVTDVQRIEVPDCARFICVHVQSGVPHVWAIVEPELPKTRRTICIVGTGNHFDVEGLEYIGSFQLYAGAFVGHVFEEVES